MNYCKYCGTVLTSNAGKCPGCGAHINYADGGQSYMTEYEVELWRRTTPVDETIPQTKEVAITPTAVGVPKPGHPKARRGLNMSNPNVVIAICAIIGVTILLLVAAIIVAVVMNSKKSPSDDLPSNVIYDTPQTHVSVQPNDPATSGFEGVYESTSEAVADISKKIMGE